MFTYRFTLLSEWVSRGRVEHRTEIKSQFHRTEPKAVGPLSRLSCVSACDGRGNHSANSILTFFMYLLLVFSLYTFWLIQKWGGKGFEPGDWNVLFINAKSDQPHRVISARKMILISHFARVCWELKFYNSNHCTNYKLTILKYDQVYTFWGEKVDIHWWNTYNDI